MANDNDWQRRTDEWVAAQQRSNMIKMEKFEKLKKLRAKKNKRRA